jgi:hypothetical protein
LEPAIWTFKEIRLNESHPDLIAERKAILQDLLTTYRKTLAPVDWVYFPAQDDLFHIPAFQKAIYNDPEVTVTAESFADVLPLLPTLVSTWQIQTRAEMAKSIELARGISTLLSRLQNQSTVEPKGEESVLLACSVFTCGWSCPNRIPVIGEEEVFRHCYHSVSSQPHYTVLSFEHFWSRIAAQVVMVAGLNFQSATSEEMDRLNLKFVCTVCPAQGLPDESEERRCRYAYTWRDCVSSFFIPRSYVTHH